MRRALARGLRLLGHLAWCAAVVPALALTRRGARLVFTHAQDVDADGRDRQMGPLVWELCRRGRPFVEVTYLSLDGGFLRNLRAKRRAFVPWPALLALGRVLA